MSKPGIPSWQRAASLPGVEEQKPTAETPQTSTEPAMLHAKQDSEPAETLTTKEKVDKFLRDPIVQGAPTEKKLAFLESKGLQRAEVEPLLANAELAAHETPSQISTPQPVRETSAPTASATTQSPAPPTAPARDVPPIITYPEFLLQETKRPPLVTKKFLANTAYIASGLAAGMYALSKWVIEPMEESLTEARHEFYHHTGGKLTGLNDKMKNMVTTVPFEKQKGTNSRPGTSSGFSNTHALNDENDDSDTESIKSDPTELYHLDKGTQTSPPRSRRTSTSSNSHSSSAVQLAALPIDPISAQESSLKAIFNRLNDLQTSTNGTNGKENDVTNELHELTRYLSEMRYSSPYFGYKPPAVIGLNGESASAGASPAAKEQDEIEKVRAEIRGIKGVLLSTRNFPRSGYR